MGFTKPTLGVDWINDDDPTKYTTPSAGDQLAGFANGVNADAKVFNWFWWRVSQWLEFLDNTFDANGNEINAPKSTTVTETISPVASCVTLDAGGIKSWDGSSNAIFSVTEAGVVTLGYSGNDVISLNAGVLTVGTATSADLVKLHAVTASYTEINQLTGNTFGGSSAGDVVTINATQTLTNKQLTTPKINEAVNLTATSTELNQLDGVAVGGSSSGDIVTIDDTQTLTNKTISFTQISAGTAAAGRTFTITGHDTTPANFAFQGSTRYTRISCDAAGTTFEILPSSNNTVAFQLGDATYKPSSLSLYSSTGGTILSTAGTLDVDAVGIDIDGTSNIIITAGADNSVLVEGGTNSAGNNYGFVWVNPSDNGTVYINVRENTATESFTFAPTYFRSGGGAALGTSSYRWGVMYGTNFDITSSSGDAIYINSSAADGIDVNDWAASSAAIRIQEPSISTTRGQIVLDATTTALATKYSNASGGEISMFNNGGTIEIWFHNGTAWTKIA